MLHRLYPNVPLSGFSREIEEEEEKILAIMQGAHDEDFCRVREGLAAIHTTLRDAHAASLVSAEQCLQDIQQASEELCRDPGRLAELLVLVSARAGGSVVDYVDGAMSPEVLSSGRFLTRELKSAFVVLNDVLQKCQDCKADVDKAALLSLRECSFHTFLLLSRMNAQQTIQAAALQVLLSVIECSSAGACQRPTASEMQLGPSTELFLRVAAKVSSGQTVRALLLQLLGIYCKHFPAEMLRSSNAIRQLFFDVLDQLAAKTEVESTTAEGLMLGFISFLDSACGGDTPAMSAALPKLYAFVKAGLLLASDTSRYQLPRAALKMLKHHAFLFRELIFNDAEGMMSTMVMACGHKNQDLHKQAFPAAAAFIQTVSQELCENTSRTAQQNLDVLHMLLANLKKLLETGGRYEVSFAVCGYGLLARPVAHFLGNTELSRLMLELSYHSEALLSRGQDELEETAKHIPQYVSAFACILLELKEVTPSHLDAVDSLLHTTLLLYPKQFNFPKIKFATSPAIVRTFLALRRQQCAGAAMALFVRRGVALSIGTSKAFAPTPAGDVAGNTNEEGDSGIVSGEGALFEEYFPLWESLLRTASDPNVIDSWGFPWSSTPSVSYSGDVVPTVADIQKEMLFTVVEVLQQFDLECVATASPEALPSSSAHHARLNVMAQRVMPRSPKDYSLFLNMVKLFGSLSHLLLQSIGAAQWGTFILRNLIELSTKHCHVSGFYTMLASVLEQMSKASYFSSPNGVDCISVLRHFAACAMQRITEYSGELLASCVMCLLQLPVVKVPGPVVSPADISKALLIALDIGVEHPPAALAALCAIDRWSTQSPGSLSSVFPLIVPKLRRFWQAAVREDKATSEKDVEAEWRAIFDALLKLIQRDGARIADALSLDPKDTKNDTWINPESRLSIKLSLSTISIDFPFDVLLPRVLQLTQESADRKTRVAACELLHSIVLWMIGVSAGVAEAPFGSVFQAAFPVVIQLAVATDNVIKELFEGLLMQSVHWFARCPTPHDRHLMALLGAIVDGLTSPGNAAVRNISSDAAVQFQRWAVRSRGALGLHNVRELYRCVFALCHHPSMWHRLGAAVVFNKLYVEFREVDELVKEFTLELIFHFFTALQAADQDDPTCGTTDQLKEALQHLEKIAVFKSQALAERDPIRSAARFVCLEDVVGWLFEQCGSIEAESRHVAMRLFTTLCSCIPGFTTDDGPMRWLAAKRYSRDSNSFISGVWDGFSLREPQRMVGADPMYLTFSKYVEWVREIEASIECHMWLLACKFMPAHEALGSRVPIDTATLAFPPKKPRTENTSIQQKGGEARQPKSQLLKHIFFFLQHLEGGGRVGGGAAASQMEWVTAAEATNANMSNRDSEELAQRRLSALEAVALLLKQLMESYPSALWCDSDCAFRPDLFPILSKPLFSLTAIAALRPTALFGVICIDSAEFQRRMFTLTTSLTGTVWQCCREFQHLQNDRKHFVDALMKNWPWSLTADSVYSSLCASPFLFSLCCRNMRILRQSGLIELLPLSSDPHGLPTTLLQVLNEIFENHGDALSQPLIIQAVREYVALMFECGLSGELFVECVLDSREMLALPSSMMRHSSSAICCKSRGTFWLQTFRSEIERFVVMRPRQVLTALSRSTNPSRRGLELDIANMLCARFALGKASQESISEFLSCWHLLGGCAAGCPIDAERLESRLRVVKELLAVSSGTALKVCQDEIVADLLAACGRSSPSLYTKHQLLSDRHAVRLLVLGFECTPLLLERALVSDAASAISTFERTIPDIVADIIVDELPITPSELQNGTVAFDSYCDVVAALLDIMVACCAALPQLVFKLLPIFRFRRHTLGTKISRSLSCALQRLSPDQRKRMCGECFEMLASPSLPVDVRRAIIFRVALPLLKLMEPHDVEQFYCAQIRPIYESVQKTSFTGSVEAASLQCVQCTCSYALLEAMYRLCSMEVLKGPINTAFCGEGGTGKELTEKVLRTCVASRSLSCDVVPPQVLVLYRQSAYACLVSAMIATQRQEKLFVQFLLTDRVSEFWSSIVDTTTKHVFNVETNFYHASSALSDLRSEWEAGQAAETDEDPRKGVNRMKYLSSQYLMDSHVSLLALPDEPNNMSQGADAEVSDKQHATQPPRSLVNYKQSLIASLRAEMAENAAPQPDSQSSKGESVPPSSSQPNESQEKENVEVDTIWSSCCSATVLRLIDFMFKSFPAASWATEIVKTLQNKDVHINVRLFLSKIITLRPVMFENSAIDLFSPLIDICTNPQLGKGIHYFARDVCLCLLKWKTQQLPPSGADSEASISKLLTFLVRNVSHSAKHIFRANLELVKLFVERWRGRATINKKDLLGWLVFDEANPQAKMARMCGVQLCGVLVANGIPLYNSRTDASVISEDTLYKKLVQNLRSSAKEVVGACAEVVGMAMALLKTLSTPLEDRTHLLAVTLSNELSLLYQSEPHDRFLFILRRIAEHYSDIVDLFLPSKLFRGWHTIPMNDHLTVFELVAMRAEQAAKSYSTLTAEIGYSAKSMSDVQRVALFELLLKLAPLLAQDDLTHVVNHWLQGAADAGTLFFTLEGRVAFFSLCVAIYNNAATTDDARVKVEHFLAKGLTDPALVIRDMALKFWDHESRLPLDGLGRLIEMMARLPPGDMGDAWLQSSSVLLLYTCHRSADFQSVDAIFPKPLAACAYTPLSLDRSWTSRSKSLAPMFSSQDQIPVSQLRTMPASLGGFTVQGPDPENFVASQVATMRERLFTPTVVGTFSSFDNTTAAVASQRMTSSLLFAPLSAASASDEPQQQVRRRFHVVQEKFQVRRHILHSAALRQQKETHERVEIAKKENRVIIFRQYRSGDVPDIQIAPQALVVPLQALCLYDLEIARQTLIVIGSALFTSITALCDPSQGGATKPTGTYSLFETLPTANVATAMEQRKKWLLGLRTIVDKNAPTGALVSFAHEMLLSSKRLADDAVAQPLSLYSSAVLTGAYRTAMLLLEKYAVDGSMPQADMRTVPKYLFLALRCCDENDIAMKVGKRLFPQNRAEYDLFVDAMSRGDMESALSNLSSIEKELRARKLAAQPDYELDDTAEVLHLEQCSAMAAMLEWNEVAGKNFVTDEALSLLNKPSKMQELIAVLRAAARCDIEATRERVQTFLDSSVDCSKLMPLEHVLLMFQSGKYDACLKACRQHLLAGLRDPRNDIGAIRDAQHYLTFNDASALLRKPSSPDKLLMSATALMKNWVADGAPTEALTYSASQWDDMLRVRDLVSSKLLGQLKNSRSDLSDVAALTAASTSYGLMRKSLCVHAATNLLNHHGTNVAAKKFLHAVLSSAAPSGFDMDVWSTVVRATVQRIHIGRFDVASVRSRYQEILAHVESKRAKNNLDTSEHARNFFLLKSEVLAEYASELARCEALGDSAFGGEQAVADAARALDSGTNASNGSAAKSVAAAAMRFTAFALDLASSGVAFSQGTTDMLGEHAVRGLCTCMENYGLLEARELFPRLLQLLETNIAAQKAFAELALTIRPWNVLPWAAQIMSALLSKAGAHVAPLLVRVAAHYPQVTFYGFHCMEEDLTEACAKGGVSAEAVKAIEVLREIACDERMRKVREFAESFNGLHFPEFRFREQISMIVQRLRDSQDSPSSEETPTAVNDAYLKAQELWSRLLVDCFDEHPGVGEYNAEWARRWRPDVRRAFLEGDALTKDYKKAQAAERDLIQQMTLGMKSNPKAKPGMQPLSYYSKTLAQLQLSSLSASHVELPQQPFCFLSSAEPQAFPKIVFVGQQTLVLRSMQMPKKIVVYTSDEQERAFLVKGGDDLRLDQRVEQMFHTVNTLLRVHRSQLCVRTYSVIPITKRLGMVEWVNGSTTLRSVIEQSMSGPKIADHAAMREYLQKYPNNVAYLSEFRSSPQHSIQAFFDHVVSLTDKKCLERGLQRLCTTAAAFYELRNTFARTLGASSVASYFVGIGDRHLDNFLVDQRTGDIIPIDFGHAFGSATSSLPIPELMPFRLTPQLVGALGYLGTDRVEPHMVAVAECIHEGRRLLEGLLSVFICEPLLNWERHSKERGRAVADQKLAVVHRKMRCENPVRILMEEVAINPHVRKEGVQKEVARVLCSDAAASVAAPLTVQGQVASLLSLATNPNILGRTYSGWCPMF